MDVMTKTVECMILEMLEVYTMAKIQNAGLLTTVVFHEDVVSHWLQEVCDLRNAGFNGNWCTQLSILP
jgi:hypothetical protein